jgi:uncharacterized protein
MIVSFEQIQALSQEIADKFQPEKIILFGSYAYGQPTQDSDVDILVILNFEGKPVQKAIEIRQSIEVTFPLDLLVKTPQKIEERLGMGDFFVRDIIQKGQVIYEVNHARVG